MASNTPHSLATEHLPMFITGPGETDVFFIAVVVIVILAIMVIGALYFTLHALPEKMAHRTNSNQIHLISIMRKKELMSHLRSQRAMRRPGPKVTGLSRLFLIPNT